MRSKAQMSNGHGVEMLCNLTARAWILLLWSWYACHILEKYKNPSFMVDQLYSRCTICLNSLEPLDDRPIRPHGLPRKLWPLCHLLCIWGMLGLIITWIISHLSWRISATSFKPSSLHSDLAVVSYFEGSRCKIASDLRPPEQIETRRHQGTPGTMSSSFGHWQHLWPRRAICSLVLAIVKTYVVIIAGEVMNALHLFLSLAFEYSSGQDTRFASKI